MNFHAKPVALDAEGVSVAWADKISGGHNIRHVLIVISTLTKEQALGEQSHLYESVVAACHRFALAHLNWRWNELRIFGSDDQLINSFGRYAVADGDMHVPGDWPKPHPENSFPTE
jgi:hypothetical protein